MITFVVDGLPTPWAAHQGYGRRSYNPRFKEKEFAKWQIRAQFNQEKPLSTPIKVDVTYHMPIPQGTSKVRKLQMLNGKMHHIKRPDLDNLNKFICDVFKQIVFDDDSQVVEINSRKIYSENPKTIVKIESVA